MRAQLLSVVGILRHDKTPRFLARYTNLYIHFFGNAVCFISYAFIIIITVPDIHGRNVLTFRFYRHVSEQVRVEFTVQTLIV